MMIMIKIQMILTLIKRETYLKTILVIDCMLSRCVAYWNFKLQTISSDVAEIHLQGINFWSWRFLLGLGDLTEIATKKFTPNRVGVQQPRGHRAHGPPVADHHHQRDLPMQQLDHCGTVLQMHGLKTGSLPHH